MTRGHPGAFQHPAWKHVTTFPTQSGRHTLIFLTTEKIHDFSWHAGLLWHSMIFQVGGTEQGMQMNNIALAFDTAIFPEVSDTAPFEHVFIHVEVTRVLVTVWRQNDVCRVGHDLRPSTSLLDSRTTSQHLHCRRVDCWNTCSEQITQQS